MYKIIGADGREYGPVDINAMREWIRQGRVSAQTRVQGPGGADWKPASDLPELGFGGVGTPNPPPLPAQKPAGEEKGLAIASFVLGVVGFLCFGPFAGIPAIICGHIARSRVRWSPAQYGGSGFALAGLILGYLSWIVPVIILSGLMLPALGKARIRAEEITCVNNMKQIGLAARIWALDNNDQFPFNVSTNKGGTLELCQPGADGFDQNAIYHFRVMSNELSTARILICPADKGKQPALDFANLQPANLSYQMRSGAELTDTNFNAVLAICPIHHTVLRCDGSVTTERKPRW